MAPETTKLYMVAAAFLLTWAIARLICKNAMRWRLVQTPNERSSHSTPTPSGGGISIAIAGTAGCLALVPTADILDSAAISLTLIAAVLGFLDDRFELSSRLRILAHVLIVAAILLAAGSLPTLPMPLGNVPAPLLYGCALLAGVWWINLFNFMDGIDGIAASEAAFLCISMALISTSPIASEQATWLRWWAIILTSACAGFLVLNWAPARIFMGDAGSNYLAVAILAIATGLIANDALEYGTVLVLGASFITDATVTLLTRVLRGQHWAVAHRQHAYQKQSRRWGTHSRVTLLYMAYNVLWLLPIAYLIQGNDGTFLLVPIAYLPVVAFSVLVGAGRSDERVPGEKD